MSDPLDQLIGWGLEGRVGWDQVARCVRAMDGEPADVVAALFGALFTEAELESLPRALGQDPKPDPWELLLLHVSGLPCDGEDLPLLDADEMRRRMEEASRLSLESPSPWLGSFTTRLVAESRSRRGVGRKI